MKYHVNETCIGCGLCAGVCPEVFTINQNGVSEAIETDVPEEALERAEEAMLSFEGVIRDFLRGDCVPLVILNRAVPSSVSEKVRKTLCPGRAVPA